MFSQSMTVSLLAGVPSMSNPVRSQQMLEAEPVRAGCGEHGRIMMLSAEAEASRFLAHSEKHCTSDHSASSGGASCNLMRMVWSLSEHILTGQQVMPVQQSAGCVCQLWSFSNSSSQLQLHLAQGLQRSVALDVSCSTCISNTTYPSTCPCCQVTCMQTATSTIFIAIGASQVISSHVVVALSDGTVM